MFMFRLLFCSTVDRTPSALSVQVEKGPENMDISTTTDKSNGKDEVIISMLIK